MTPTPAQIRKARLAADLTQRQAAALIGYSLRMWEEWEAGRYPMRAVLWQAWNDSVKRNNDASAKKLPDLRYSISDAAEPD